MTKDFGSFWRWVDTRMDQLEIRSYRELAKKAGLSHGTINAQKNHGNPLTVQMAEGLCQALKVDWVELWTQAGYIQKLPAISDLQGLDAEIYLSLLDTDDDFKRAVLATIKIWRVLDHAEKNTSPNP